MGRNNYAPDRVYLEDLRELKYCSSGIREWFKKYNLDYRDMLHNGISFSDVLGANDAMGVAAVAIAKKRQGNG